MTFARTTNLVLVLAGLHASGCASDAAESGAGSAEAPLSSGSGPSVEAEAAGNTLTGLAAAGACSACSGGARVGWIGSGSAGTGSLRFEGIRIDVDASYDLAISYVNGDAGDRYASVSIDGAPPVAVTFPATGGWDGSTVGIVHVSAHLAAGTHSVLLSNGGGWAPDIDRLVVMSPGAASPAPAGGGNGTGGTARPAHVSVTGAPGTLPTSGYTNVHCEGMDPGATTSCLQAALDSAAAAGQALLLPSGATYTISSPLKVTTSLVSLGSAATIHTNDGGRNWGLNNILDVSGSNLWISNLHLTVVFTTGSNIEYDAAIVLKTGSNITVSGNLIENTTGDGLQLGNEFVSDGVVRNVFVDGNTFRNDSRVAIFGNLCDRAWIGNNVFVKPWAFEPTVDFEPDANPGCVNVEVSYNSFDHDRTPRYPDGASEHAIFAAQHNNWNPSVSQPGGYYYMHHNYGPSFGKSGFWGYWTDGFNGFLPAGNPAALESHNAEGIAPLP